MPIEAEIKARVRDPQRLIAALEGHSTGERSTYHDRYFDLPDRRWTRDGHELRVRTVVAESGATRTVLTFKEPAVDPATASKPEHETRVDDPDVLVTVLAALGAEEIIAFEKRCLNYRLNAQGRELLATIVTVPELGEETFLELETRAAERDTEAALSVVRSVLAELGIPPEDFTTEQYTEAVAARRGQD